MLHLLRLLDYQLLDLENLSNYLYQTFDIELVLKMVYQLSKLLLLKLQLR